MLLDFGRSIAVTKMNKAVCKICGQEQVMGMQMHYMYGEGVLLCPNCARQWYTCGSCQHGQECAAQENKLNIQPVIVKTVTQGGRTIQYQAPNPELIQAYCPTCACWNEGCCGRQTVGYCEKWDLHEIIKERLGEVENGVY